MERDLCAMDQIRKQFCIDGEVFERLPGACFGVVVADGIDNSAENPEISRLLDAEIAAAAERLAGIDLKQHLPVAWYREAFSALGMNPNKFMSSIEALYKRICKTPMLPKINPIVDIGNAMSLKYALPMGAHDVDKLVGNLDVRFSTADDHFLPFGETTLEQLTPGELVYASQSTVKTRRWIWRQSDDGKIDAGSRHVIFPIDGFWGKNDAQVLQARDELAQHLQKLFDCEIRTGFLDERNTRIDL